MMSIAIVLALVASTFVSTATAQQSLRRSAPSLTSEDLLDRPSPYSPAANPSGISSSSRSSSSEPTPVGALYRDPAGAFSLNLPSGSWHLNNKSRDKGKLSDLRVFRKLDADGFASATASVYVLSATASLTVERIAQVEATGQRALAEALVARFLSNNAEIVSASADAQSERAGFQVVADQLVSRRAVVRALISAFEHEGKVYVVVCRAPLESFDAQASEFSAITQSLAISVARSS
ncbi:MAG TPA: hypothetical protein VGC66_21660 [Pyrinomonadaceae bacterium]